MTTARPRRWLSFNLRTLFVLVTLVCCWAGYSMNWIRQRHAFLAEAAAFDSGQDVRVTLNLRMPAPDGSTRMDPPASTPWLLQAFGEPPIDEINAVHFGTLPESWFNRARRLFPEAHIENIDLL